MHSEIEKKTGPHAKWGGQYTMLFRGGHRANHRRIPDVRKMNWDDLGTNRKKKDEYDQYAEGSDDDEGENEETKNNDVNDDVNFDLTQEMPSFDRNTRYSHPSVDQPYRPFNYSRGHKTANHIHRYFSRNKRYEVKELEDDQTRIFIPTFRKGMIIGKRHTTRVEIEEQFNVSLKIAQGECDDRMTPVIIVGTSEEQRNLCKEHIEGIISGAIRKPREKDLPSESSSSESESDEDEPEVEERHDRPDRTTTDSDGDRPEERMRARKQHVRKILYKEHSSVRRRPAVDVVDWRKNQGNDLKISFMSKNEMVREYKPCLSFEEAFWNFPLILKHLSAQKFEKPSPIQSQLWPIALSGRDAIGISQTGSGKTLAFLAPMVAHCLFGGVLTHPDVGSTIDEEPTEEEGETSGTDREEIDEPLSFNMQIRDDYEAGEPMGLVIAPTRELANQIKEQVDKVFGILEKTSTSGRSNANTDFFSGRDNKRPITTMLAVGGTDRRDDITRLQDGSPPTIVIGTPGRLNDLSEMGELKLHKCTFVVLDEADKMLDQGFRGDIEKLLERTNMPKKRQIIMTSATWPVEIQKFAKQYMGKAVKIIVGKFDLSCVKSVTQSVIKVNNESDKFKELCKYIDELRNSGEKNTDIESDSDDETIEIVAGGNNRRADSPEPRLEGESSSGEENEPAPPQNAEGGEGWDVPRNDHGWEGQNQGGWSDNEPDEGTGAPEGNANNGGWEGRGVGGGFVSREDEVIKRDWKLMVFCGRKDTVDAVYDKLRSAYRRFSKVIGAMHGDFEQIERNRALKKLRNGQTQVMVCTDVAARGIDVKDITHVFSYDLAVNIDDHCHRIGRTGRAGRHGKACTLFNVADNRDLKKADLFWKLLVESTMDGGDLMPVSESSDTDVLKKRTINKKYAWLQRLAQKTDSKRAIMKAAGRRF